MERYWSIKKIPSSSQISRKSRFRWISQKTENWKNAIQPFVKRQNVALWRNITLDVVSIPNILRQRRFFPLTIVYKKCWTIFFPLLGWCTRFNWVSLSLLYIRSSQSKGFFLFIAFLIILYYLFPSFCLAINCDAHVLIHTFSIKTNNEMCSTHYLLQKQLAQYGHMHKYQS